MLSKRQTSFPRENTASAGGEASLTQKRKLAPAQLTVMFCCADKLTDLQMLKVFTNLRWWLTGQYLSALQPDWSDSAGGRGYRIWQHFPREREALSWTVALIFYCTLDDKLWCKLPARQQRSSLSREVCTRLSFPFSRVRILLSIEVKHCRYINEKLETDLFANIKSLCSMRVYYALLLRIKHYQCG